jgi:hypothetical protein
MRLACLIVGLLSCFQYHCQWRENTSPSYPELISYLQKIDKEHKEIKLFNMGDSDYGLPIYLLIINAEKDSLKTFQKARKSTTVLINNAIHPGEPDGINASLIWIDQWINHGKPSKTKNGESLPVIAFIPAYNVGGMMNRSTSSRANQNGPEEYGFRGNARNLDLNRDFIKMDSENAFTFARIFHALDPDVFVDNHVSNGADYQYTLTYISSMKERLAPTMNQLTYSKCIPSLTANLREKGIDLFPYVELIKQTPEEGIMAFNDLPRYAMGFSSLFNSLSFTVETHMLKPFPERVEATYQFLYELISWTTNHSSEIESSRSEAIQWCMDQKEFEYNYELSDKKDSILFKGFEFSNPIDSTTGLKRLYYDRSKSYQKFIPLYQTHLAKSVELIPKYFIVGRQEKEVIERLKLNQVMYQTITKDSIIEVNRYRIEKFKSLDKPYEGHFKHHSIEFVKFKVTQSLKKGDILIPTKQKAINFLLSTLIPDAEDAYFSWNFFDSYLQQKEYFSSYVFIDQVKFILDNNPTLKVEFEKRKNENEQFRNSEWEQLYFIYKNSEYFEKSFMILPVYSID